MATNLLFALSHAVKNRPEFATKAVSIRWPNYPMMDIAIAHIVLISGDPTRASDAAQIAVLPLLNSKDYESYYSHYYFDIGDDEARLCKLISSLPESSKLPVLQTLCEVLPNLPNDMSAASIAETLLFVAFDSKSLPSDLGELTQEQRVVLKQIDRTKQFVHIDDKYIEILLHLQQCGILAKLGIKSRERGKW